jgi:hypothetical protein
MAIIGVKQYKAHTPQRRKWVWIWKVYILLPSRPNFVAKSMVEINPPLIRQLRFTNVR